MRFRRIGWLVLSLLVLALAACGNVTPHITAATLGTVVQAGKIQDPKTTFAPTDHMIHLVVDVQDVIQNTTVGAKWYATDENNRLLYQGDSQLDAFNTSADFALTAANDWTPGNYRVVVYLNNNEDRTLNFVVK